MPGSFFSNLLGSAISSAGSIFGGGGSQGTSILGRIANIALAGAALYAVTKLFAPDVDRRRPDTRRPGPALAIEPARWVVGRARTGGVRVFYQQVGRDLWMVMPISEGVCDNIEKVWVDGVPVAFTRSGNTLTFGNSTPRGSDPVRNFRDRLTVYQYFAANGAQGAEVQAACSNWTADHRGHGISWVAIKLHQPDYGDDTEKRFWSHIPQVEFLVRGIRITWPGQTSAAWTENAAAIRYWWETVRKGIPASVIDRTSFNAALARCGGTVTFTPPAAYNAFTRSFPRYTANGIISAAHRAEDISSELDQAWQGNIAEAGGVLHFNAGADRAVRFNLTEQDVMEMGAVQTGPALQDRVNTITMTVQQSRDHEYLAYDLPEIRDPDAFTRDLNTHLPLDTGERLFIDGPIRAAWLGYIALREARGSMRTSVRLFSGTETEPFTYLGILPGQWVNFSNAEIGLTQKLFSVVSRTINEDLSVSLLLEEQFTGNFAENLTLPPLLPRDINLGDVGVPDVTGLTLDEIAEVQKDGTTLVFLYAMWTSASATTEVQMRKKDTTDVVNLSTKLKRVGQSGVRVGETWEVRARHLNRSDVAGDWSDWVERTIGGDLTPPADPTGVTFTSIPEGGEVKWATPPDSDYNHTRIYLTTDATAMFSESLFLDTNDAGSYPILGYLRPTALRGWVRHVDNSGNMSGEVAFSGTTGKVGSRNLNLDPKTFGVNDDDPDDPNPLFGLLPNLLELLLNGVQPRPDNPTLRITDIESITEDQTALLEAFVEGGTYDEIEYKWEIVSGGGTIDPVSDD